jgi:hypothetical protein
MQIGDWFTTARLLRNLSVPFAKDRLDFRARTGIHWKCLVYLDGVTTPIWHNASPCQASNRKLFLQMIHFDAFIPRQWSNYFKALRRH